MPTKHDYYEVLQVSPNADEEIIQAAYRRLAQKWHPDKNPGDPFAYERMKLLNEAYETLADPQKRRTYDARTGRMPRTETREVPRQSEQDSSQATDSSAARTSDAATPRREAGAAAQAEEEPDSWHWHVALFLSALAAGVLLKVVGLGGFWAALIGFSIGKGMAMLLVPQPNGNAPGWANGLWGSGTTRPRHWFAIAGIGVIIVVVVTLIVNYDQSPASPQTSASPQTWAQYEKVNAAHFFKSQEAIEEFHRTELPNVDLQKHLPGLIADDAYAFWAAEGVVGALKDAASEAKSVSPDVLAKAHPKLPEVYKDSYIRALELAIRAYERKIRSQESTELWNQWIAWWKANKKDVRFPEDVRK